MSAILLLEPDPAVGGLFETALQQAGYDVYRASEVGTGYEIMRRTEVEMVITDLNLPAGDGLEFVATVRHDFPHAKVVGISTEASEFDPMQAAPLLDTIEVLSNPLHIHHLIETVQRILPSDH